MTYGQNLALTILAAYELGVNVSFKKNAEELLQTGSIKPAKMARLEQEAIRCGREARFTFGLLQCVEAFNNKKVKYERT